MTGSSQTKTKVDYHCPRRTAAKTISDGFMPTKFFLMFVAQKFYTFILKQTQNI